MSQRQWGAWPIRTSCVVRPQAATRAAAASTLRVIQRLEGARAGCLALYLAGGVTGDLLEQMLAAERVSSRRLSIAGETRENFSVKERSTGREFRFLLPNPIVSTAEWVAV